MLQHGMGTGHSSFISSVGLGLVMVWLPQELTPSEMVSPDSQSVTWMSGGYKIHGMSTPSLKAPRVLFMQVKALFTPFASSSHHLLPPNP